MPHRGPAPAQPRPGLPAEARRLLSPRLWLVCSKLSDSRTFREGYATRAAPRLIRPVVGELQLQAQILAAQQRDDTLQLIAILTGDSHRVALNAGLRLFFRIFHQAHNLLGLL